MIRYSDDELLTAPVLPCQTCGADIEIRRRSPDGGYPRMALLRDRIANMHRYGWTKWKNAADATVYHLDEDLAELRTLPGVYCHRGHMACPLRWADCAYCGQQFHQKRSDARYCSGRCRVANHRQKETR